jgi:gas vesicle protein
MSYREEDNNSGKIILAALAGASAGILAGILLAPDKGTATLENWKGTAKGYGDKLGDQFNKYSTDLETKFKGLSDKLEATGILGAGGSLNIAGNWDEIKGDELVGKLQEKLGKGKSEITKLINGLSGKAQDVAADAGNAAEDATK